MKQTFLKKHLEDLKSYTEEEFDKIDYELNLIDMSVVDVDLIRRDIVNQLGRPVHTFSKYTDWYLNYNGQIFKAMFVNGDNGRFKTLYLSSELPINNKVINAIEESFKKEFDEKEDEI